MTLATLDPSNIVAALDRGRKALAECRDDFDRLQVRDQAAAAVAAAKILERRDIQNSAQWLVYRAERAIAKANPPEAANQYTGKVDITAGVKSIVPAPRLSEMRTAASVMTDDEVNAAEKASIANPEATPAPTRSKLLKEARRSRETTAQERHAVACEVSKPIRRCSLSLRCQQIASLRCAR